MARQGGFGLVLKIEVSASLTAVTFAEDIGVPEFEKFLTEVTNHDSPSGYVEKIATGKRAMNPFTCTLTWDTTEATHAAVLAAFDSNSAVNMSVEDPAGDEVIKFAAHVSKLGRLGQQDGAWRCQVTIEPTGAPTIV